MSYRTEDVVVDVGGGERIKYEVYVDLETGLDIDPVTGDMKSREETVAYLQEVYHVGASGDLRRDLERYNEWIRTPGAKEKEKSLFRQPDGAAHSKPTSLFSSADKRKSEALALKEAGNDALSSGKFRLAVKRYTEGLALDSTSVALWANRSEAHLRLKRFQEALKDADMALSLDRMHEKSLFRRCSASIGLGDTVAALKDVAEGQRRFPSNPSWGALSTEILKLIEEPIVICPAEEELNSMPSLVIRRLASAGECLGLRIDKCIQWSRGSADTDTEQVLRLESSPDISPLAVVQAVVASIAALPNAKERATTIKALWDMFRTFETTARYSYAVVSSSTAPSRCSNETDFQFIDSEVAKLAFLSDETISQEEAEEVQGRAEGVVHRLLLYSRLGATLLVGKNLYLHPMFLLLGKSGTSSGASRTKASESVTGTLHDVKPMAVEIISDPIALCALQLNCVISSAVNQKNLTLDLSSSWPKPVQDSEPMAGQGQWWFGV